MSSHGVAERVKRNLFLSDNFFFITNTQRKEEQAFRGKICVSKRKYKKMHRGGEIKMDARKERKDNVRIAFRRFIFKNIFTIGPLL
jgi:hypothetical protein